MNSTHPTINELLDFLHNKPDITLNKALDLYKNAFSTLSESNRGELIYIIAAAYWIEGNYKKSMLFCQLNIEKQYSEKSNIFTYKILGNIAIDSGKLSDALDYYNQGLNLCISSNRTELYSDFYNNIGSIYSDINKFDQAIFYYKKSLQFAPSGAVTNSIYYINLGENYIEKQDLSTAKVYLDKAEDILTKDEAVFISSYLYTVYGKYNRQLKKYDQALKFLDKSNQIFKSLNVPYRSIENHYLSYLVYTDIKDINKAIDSLIKAYNLSKKFKDYSSLARFSSLLALNYEKNDEQQKAYNYYKKFYKYDKKRNNIIEEQRFNLIFTKEKIKEIEQERNLANQENKALTELNNKIELINNIGKEITTDLEFKKVALKINALLANYFSIDFLVISSLSASKESLNFIEIINAPNNEMEIIDDEALLKDTLAEWVLDHEEIIYSNNYRKDYIKYKKILRSSIEETPNSIIVLPLKLKTTTIGFFSIQSKKANAYSEQSLEFLQTLAPFIAIALQNSINSENLRKEIDENIKIKKRLEKANEKLRILSNYDDLTNIPNRRYLFSHLEKEINLSYRQKKPLTLLIIDIDYFKEYNDNYGHVKGDHCLKIVAQILNNALKRKSDFVARYGGDEFMIVLPNTEKSGALVLVDEIHKNLIDENIKHHFSPISEYLTLSIGGHTTYGYREYQSEILIKEADDALYLVKNQGRNNFLITTDEKQNA